MRSKRVISAALFLLLSFGWLSACDSGNEALDTSSLSQITLRIEGMT